MRVIISWRTYLSCDKNQYVGPFMRPQWAVNRTKMRHLKGHPKLNLNQLTMVDSLKECPKLNPSQWTATHLEYMAYSLSEGASKSKPSPTEAHENDADDGTRSKPSDPIRL